MLLLRRWHQARVALAWWISHDATKEVARTMANGRRLRLRNTSVSRQATYTNMRRGATSSFEFMVQACDFIFIPKSKRLSNSI